MTGVKTKLIATFLAFWRKLFVTVKDGTGFSSACVINADLSTLHTRNWLCDGFLEASMNSLPGVKQFGMSLLLLMFRPLLRFSQGRICARAFLFVVER